MEEWHNELVAKIADWNDNVHQRDAASTLQATLKNHLLTLNPKP